MKLNLPLGFLSRLTLLTVGTQDYMKLSDVYRMYNGGCRPERGEPACHNRSFAVDAALAGACCEVPTLPVCLSPQSSALACFVMLLPLLVVL